MWVLIDVCRLFANNVGSFSFNSGRRGRIFANNSGRKCGCLQVLWVMFAGRYNYAAYIASIHLTAIRFCLLVIAKQTQGAASIALMRQKLCSNSTDISFAGKLWQVFRAVITGALDELRVVLGDAATLVMETIDAHIQCLFTQVLQLDPRTLRLEAL